MNLAILHYHLNSGGVTRVIENHLLALAATRVPGVPERVLILHGGQSSAWSQAALAQQLPYPLACVTVDGLDYDQSGAIADSRLAKNIEAALRDAGCRTDSTVLHWHNHSLGKNVSAPLAIRRLADDGYRTLLQIHDFAEDFRPDNYRRLATGLAKDPSEPVATILYPQAAHIHYATLNRRDYHILGSAGVDSRRLHLLPNPVAAPPKVSDAAHARQLLNAALGIPAEQRLLTYPVRGIRRKNIGEMLLWSAATEDAWFHVTLAPENPVERASFDRWQQFAEQLSLPCRFGTPTSERLTYGQVLAASDVLLTTSIAEGFGMAFLEAWLAGRRLWGRDLPEITGDFQQAGLDLSELYPAIGIPSEWIDRRQFVDHVAQLYEQTCAAFGVSDLRGDLLRTALAERLDQPCVDFAMLPTTLQRGVIQRVRASRKAREALVAMNPKLCLASSENENLVDANSAVVYERFSLSATGRQLAKVYSSLLNTRPGQEISPPAHGEAVLRSLLSIDRFHSIRVEP